MNSRDFKLKAIEVISYGRFHNLLKPVECILLHQWAQLNLLPNTMLRNKFYKLKDEIEKNNWETPEFQYNNELKLTYKTKDMENFKAVPNSN